MILETNIKRYWTKELVWSSAYFLVDLSISHVKHLKGQKYSGVWLKDFSPLCPYQQQNALYWFHVGCDHRKNSWKWWAVAQHLGDTGNTWQPSVNLNKSILVQYLYLLKYMLYDYFLTKTPYLHCSTQIVWVKYLVTSSLNFSAFVKSN